MRLLGRRLAPSMQIRLALVFATGALVVSAALTIIAYTYSRGYLLDQFAGIATRQAYSNARLVRDQLLPGNVDMTTLLTSLGGPSGSQSVVAYRGRWYASSLAEGLAALPTPLVSRVLAGQPAEQRFRLPSGPRLAVGLPVPEAHAYYFAIYSLNSLARTLHAIAVSLLVGAAATTIGGALLGYWTSRRLTRPVLEVAEASARIAEGQLSTRLQVASDRELAKLSRSFNEMADALQRRIERDARFVADVTHELRSPLTTLSLTLSVLKARRGSLPPRGQQALDLLEGELMRFQRLVDDLLEMGRVDLTASQPELTRIPVAEFVRRLCRDHLPPEVQVSVDSRLADVEIQLDKRRLERALVNLFDNAKRHAGGVCEVRLEASPGAAQIVVVDHGPGVPEHERERIFERFARVSPARDRTDGAGLGLALAREHVLAHGGRIWVEDA
ncbi:MAG: sensor histidine kinase, partial [Mycobacteriales bacterium]